MNEKDDLERISNLTYEQLRLEFFRQLKNHHEQRLFWWKNQKPYHKGYKHYDAANIHEQCCYHGAAINYCDDAIKVFGRTEIEREFEHGLSINVPKVPL